MKKKIILSIAAVAAVSVITGCGSSSSSSSDNNTLPETTVKVVDGYVIGANVCDANGVCATTNSQGEATAAFDLNTSLKSCGGYIDVNNNGEIDDADLQIPSDKCMAAPAGSTVITPMTLLVAAGANPDKLAEVTGLSTEELYADPIATNDVNLAKAIQITFAVMVDGKLNDLVAKINAYNTEEANTTETTATDTTTSNVSGDTTVLPVIKADTEDNTTAEANTTAETTVAAASGNLETFANLAKEVLDSDVAKTFVDQVVSVEAANAADVEVQLATEKKDMAVALCDTEAETAATTADTTAEEANATAETNTTTTEEETTTTETSGSTSVLPAI